MHFGLIFDNFIKGKLLSLETIGKYPIFFKPFRRERERENPSYPTWHDAVVEGSLLNTEDHLGHLAQPLVGHAEGDLGGQQDPRLVLPAQPVVDGDRGVVLLILPGQGEHVDGSLALCDGVIARVAPEEGGHAGLLARLDGLYVESGLGGVSGRELDQAAGLRPPHIQ